MNLLTDEWIPVQRQHSGAGVASLVQIAEAIESDPVVALDWPRADFRIATMELLTGLLATSCPPADARAWLDWWECPPDADALRAAFAPYAHAFELDGGDARFLQDFEDLVSEAEPIERLLIEAPGDSTVKKNTDLLVHRGQVASLGRPAAAIALYTFQAWAPAGGAGNRTGLRGGGPLTTFVVPGEQVALWHLLWANVPLGAPPDAADLPRVFPWLRPTVPSGTDRPITPDVAHPLQAWWGMPRRIRLDFQPSEPARPCGLTGVTDTVQVLSWRQRPQGANYSGWGDMHPLTPRYRIKPTTEILPVHPQPGGIGYRHWVGLVVSDATDAALRWPAPCVSTWRGGRAQDALDGRSTGGAVRLLAAGYDMDNMKARGFVESEMPLPTIADAGTRQKVDTLARALVRSADLVAGLLRRTVREALFSAGASVKLDWELLSAVREQLWNGTEAAFHEALAREAARTQEDGDPEPALWLARLRALSLDLFVSAAPLAADGGGLAKSDEALLRHLRAKRSLGLALSGYGRDGGLLFDILGLPPRPSTPARKGRR